MAGQQRDINKIDKTVLDNFYRLVHSQPNIRMTAASSTFKILSAMKANKPQTFNEHLNYCLDRLVAGLASNRALARRGYGTLLLEILRSFQVSTDRLFTIAEQKFGHISKETSRDNLMGYFLLLAIVLHSGNYDRSKANTQYLEKIYNYLIQLHDTKSYLEYSVCYIITEYYYVFHPYMLADIPPQAFASDTKLSSTDLLIIVLCNKKEPVRDLLCLDNSGLTKLCSVLLDAKFQSRPLHPAFYEVSLFIITNFTNQFQTFYDDILFPTFFKANHNELAAMGLELTASLIESTDHGDIIRILISDHIVRTLILSLRKQNSLQKHCVKFFDKLDKHFKSLGDKDVASNKQALILNKLMTNPGSIAFDEDSKSSSIANLLQSCGKNVLKEHLRKLMSPANDIRTQRIQISRAKQLAFVIRRPQLVEDIREEKLQSLTDDHVLIKVTKFLMCKSFFKEDSWADLTPNIPVKEAFKNAYHSTLDHIVSVCNHTQRIECLTKLLDYADEMLKQDDVDLVDLWPKYKSGLEKHKKYIKKHAKSTQLYPITNLFLFYGLQIVEHQLDCLSQIEELIQTSVDALEADPSDGSWADVLTDQIIAILSATECNPWIRNLCGSVFGSLLPHISQTSIDLLCDAIKEPLDDNDDSDSDCESDDEEESKSEDDDDEDDDDKMSVDEDQSLADSRSKGIKRKVSGDDEEKGEEEEEEEEYLTDEQMMKYDPILAEMFKLKKSKKADNSTFRLRCLDLVKKVLSKKSNDSEAIKTILSTIIPLASKKSPVSDKITTILSKMPSKSKYPNVVAFMEKKKGNKAK